jgi:hypothetical protein
MARPARQRIWVKVLTAELQAAIAASCQRFITKTLKPRFLPEIRPTQFNYVVDLRGKRRGCKYSFIARYRSGFADNLGEEFDAPFARLDHVEERSDGVLFDVMWRRHTGQWRRLHAEISLEEALRLVETEPHLRPHI